MDLKKLVLGIILLFPITVCAQIVEIPAVANVTLAKDYVRVSWHVTQFVPGTCQEKSNVNEWTGEPQGDLNAVNCLQKVEKDQEKLFATRAEADDFLKTKPSSDFQLTYRAEITNIQIDEVHD